MRFLLAVCLLQLSAAATAQNVYFGSLHAHTSYSDGRGTPDEAFASARAAGLDFFAVTEHNHDEGDGTGDANDDLIIHADPDLYSGTPTSLRESAERHTQDGSFVALYGQEFSTISSGNHVNVFEVPNVITVPNGEFRLLADSPQIASGLGALMQFNHPRNEARFPDDYGRTDFADLREWIAELDPHVDLIEVLNAPALSDGEGHRAKRHQSEYFGYLNLGFHIAPSVGHDNHYRNWGRSTDARIAVIAPSLTRVSLLQALRQRHTYATEDANLRIIFTINSALGGDIVPPPASGSELPIMLRISDEDEPNALYRVDVYQDFPGGHPARAPVETFEFRAPTSPILLDGVRFAGPGSFVLLRITQFSSDEHGEDDRAWTAPIWFESPTQPPALATSLRIAGILANPDGDERQREAVTIRNDGASPVDLNGWRLRDLAENEWKLVSQGPLAPGAETTILRNGQPLSLNNGGDIIELIDREGIAVEIVEYGEAAEGQILEPPID